MRGLVIKNTGSWYTVRTEDGRDIESKIKGNFRLKDIKSTNPVTVGDRVVIDINKEGTAFITEIEERKNYIIPGYCRCPAPPHRAAWSTPGPPCGPLERHRACQPVHPPA